MMKTDIDLILPVYNPDKGWELTVVSKYKELNALWKHVDIHLYLVNDGSTRGVEENVINYIRQNIPDLIMEEVPVKLREAVCFSVFGFEICWKELLRSLYMKSSERWKYKFGVLPKK